MSTSPVENPIITITEAAEICGLSRTKASQLVRGNVIPSSTDATGALVLHRAEVIFWRDHGRTQDWLGAMQKEGTRIAERTLLATFVESMGDAFGKVLAEAETSTRR